MEMKQLYRVCDGVDVRDDCFDLEKKTILHREGVVLARDGFEGLVMRKNYTSQAHWKA